MKRTVSSDRPFGAFSDSIIVSNPYRYWSTSIWRTRSTVSCTAAIHSSARGFKDRGGTLFGWSLTMFPGRNHLLRTVQAVFRRQSLSKLPESLRQASRHRSMSASRVDQPILSRTAPWAISGSNPMASSTWDGCTLPDEHAEPDDTATPARSKPMTAVSAFRPGTVKRVVLGNLWTESENMMAS